MRHLRRGGYLIAMIHQTSGRIFKRKLKEHRLEEINPAQGRILFVLWEKDNIPIRELARRTALGKSTLTNMLDRLEKAGHLQRIHSTTDRRKIMIRLTEKNKKMRNVYHAVSSEMIELFYRGFTTAEISSFEKMLDRIRVNLKGEEEVSQRSRAPVSPSVRPSQR